MFKLKKSLPILVLIIVLILFFYFRLYHYLSLEALKQHQEVLLKYTQKHMLLAIVIFILAYAIIAAASIPGALFATIAGGFIFGPIFGTLYVVIGATIGAAILFVAAKTAFYDLFAKKSGKWLHKFEDGFKNNAVSYLLFLRLVPLFPFWLVNIVPAILGVRFITFIWTTFLGIIPGAFVYVLVGNGLGEVFASGQQADLAIIFKPAIIAPIIALAILSLVPILYKKYYKKTQKIRNRNGNLKSTDKSTK